MIVSRPAAQLALVVAMYGLLASPVLAQTHVDIRPRSDGTQIFTNGFDDATSTEYPSLRVFGWDFAEDPGDPNFISDPGFNSPAGSGLLPGGTLAFDVLGPSADNPLPFNLSYWDGTTLSGGQPLWTGAPAGETIRLNLGGSNLLVSDGTALLPGFNIATVLADGSIHRHLNNFLQQNGGSGGPLETPTAGIYAMSMVLRETGLTTSEPFWLVFNNGLDEAAHDFAMASLEPTAVPEPGVWLLLCVAAGAWGVRRTMRRSVTPCGGPWQSAAPLPRRPADHASR